MLNRSAIILRPAQPYLDWARSVGQSDLEPHREGEQTIWLVPEIGDEQERDEILLEGWSALFENMLGEWHTVEADWPQGRTFEMFQQWFEIEVHTLVIDIVDGPLQSE